MTVGVGGGIKLTHRLVTGRAMNGDLAIVDYAAAPWHFLYFLPEPQGHGSLRPTLSPVPRWRWEPFATGASCNFQFALFFAVELFLERIDGGGGLAGGNGYLARSRIRVKG